jgi:hypothetical protein
VRTLQLPEFYISESTSVNGTKVTNVDNVIRYNNIKVVMGCGTKTEFSSSLLDGKVYQQSSCVDATNVTLKVLFDSVSWLNDVSKLWNIYTGFDRAYDVSLSGGSVSGLPSGTNEAATSIPTSHIMFKNSYSSSKPNNVTITAPAHYLIFQADANSALQSGSSVTELGCISFSWDVYLNSDLTKVATGVKKSITRQYTVSRA